MIVIIITDIDLLLNIHARRLKEKRNFFSNQTIDKLPLTFSLVKYIICSPDDTSEIAAILSDVAKPLTLLRRFSANGTGPWSCPWFSGVWCWCWCKLWLKWSFNRSLSTGENPCTIWILFEIPDECTHNKMKLIKTKHDQIIKPLWITAKKFIAQGNCFFF